MQPTTPVQPEIPDTDPEQPVQATVSVSQPTLRDWLTKKPVIISFACVFAAISSILLLHSFADTITQTKTWQNATDWTTNSTLDHVSVANNAVTLAPVPVASTTPDPTNLALQKPVTASSTQGTGYEAAKAVDGLTTTRWASKAPTRNTKTTDWIYVDLGTSYKVSEVKLLWDQAYAKSYQVQVSSDAKTWTSIYSTTSGVGGTNDLTGLNGTGRYVRMYASAKTRTGYSLQEFQVYGASSTTGTTPVPPPVTTYSTAGTITLNYAAETGAGSTAAVDWISATPQASTPTGTTVSYQYATSSDGSAWSAWSSDITQLVNSHYLRVQAKLSTTNAAVTPSLTSLIVTYGVTTATPPPPVPTVTLTASPTTVASASSATLTWSSTNSTSCTASGTWSGSKATSGTASTGALTANSTYTLACTGAGGTANASTTVTVTAPAPAPAPTSPSGQAMPGTITGYNQVCGEDFTKDAPTGSWGTTDSSKVVYTGGCQWREYPDGWPATYTNGAVGYAPAQVLSVHDGVLDFNLQPINGHAAGANPSPFLSNTGTVYQTYGKYIYRMRTDHVDGYHIAWLLWPKGDTDWQYAETDFPEMGMASNDVSAFAHYGGSGSQEAFSKSIDTTQWHTYEQDWTPTSRSFYIDGQLIGTTTKALYTGLERFQLQTEPSGTAAGGTGHQLVDWVAVYAPN